MQASRGSSKQVLIVQFSLLQRPFKLPELFYGCSMGIPAFPHSASDQFFSCVVFWAAIWAAVFSCKGLKQNRFLYQYGNFEQSAQMALLPLQHSQKTQLTRSFIEGPHSRIVAPEKYNLKPLTSGGINLLFRPRVNARRVLIGTQVFLLSCGKSTSAGYSS